jgi:hypothetical protein
MPKTRASRLNYVVVVGERERERGREGERGGERGREKRERKERDREIERSIITLSAVSLSKALLNLGDAKNSCIQVELCGGSGRERGREGERGREKRERKERDREEREKREI